VVTDTGKEMRENRESILTMMIHQEATRRKRTLEGLLFHMMTYSEMIVRWWCWRRGS
jgi:hypothetical protein